MSLTAGVLHVELAPDVEGWFTGSQVAELHAANLAHHRPHVPEQLAQVRDAVGTLTRTDPTTWHHMRQVHGAAVATVDAATPIGAELRDVDVVVTRLADRPLVVLAADCIPLLAAGRSAIGAAHAGWRGLRADVPGALVGALRSLGERPEDLRVVLGPAIGPCCYEVGPEVVSAVRQIDPDAVTTARAGSPSVDLRAAARTRLGALGVVDVVDATAEASRAEVSLVGTVEGRPGELEGSSPGCTACGAGWFSHRRDPSAGRQAGIVVRRGRTVT